MIRQHSLDSETIARLRQLVVSAYSGRDDLYAAAKQLTDQDLSVICRKLADDLGGNTAVLEQIIVMQGAEPGIKPFFRESGLQYLRIAFGADSQGRSCGARQRSIASSAPRARLYLSRRLHVSAMSRSTRHDNPCETSGEDH